jgi:hypothetical protein
MDWVNDMRRFLNQWHELKAEFPIKSILDALMGGIVFGMLIFLPIYIILVEVAMIFMYRLYTFSVIILFVVLLNILIINKLAAKALMLKKPDHTSDIKTVWMINASIWMSFVLMIGIIFIVFIIPLLWV